MGMLLERTGLAEDMLLALNGLFGRISGGLAYTVIIVGAVLSAITGFVSASVMALGLISLPVMLRLGYNHRFASGHHCRRRYAGSNLAAEPGTDRPG